MTEYTHHESKLRGAKLMFGAKHFDKRAPRQIADDLLKGEVPSSISLVAGGPNEGVDIPERQSPAGA